MYPSLKRLIDVIGSAVGCVLFVPIFPLVALAIKLSSPGPVLYQSKRLGKNGVPFGMHKFRTMVVDAELVLEKLLESDAEVRHEYLTTYKLRNDPRITKVGAFLRKTSLDEFPQILNVLKGDMSLVGPRPILHHEIKEYRASEDFREKLLAVRPGITGMWQVSGRSSLTYKQRMDLNNYYVEHLCFWLDLKILLKTVPAVLRGENAE